MADTLIPLPLLTYARRVDHDYPGAEWGQESRWDYTASVGGRTVGYVEVCGCPQLIPDWRHVQQVWVHPDLRGRGVAGWLLGWALADADDAAAEVTLAALAEDGGPDEATLVALYARRGFRRHRVGAGLPGVAMRRPARAGSTRR